MSHKLLIFFIIVYTNLVSCVSQPPHPTIENSTNQAQTNTNTSCIQNRGAIEIGSGVTKAQLAMVDICLQKVVSTFWTKDFKIDFKANISQNFKLNGEKKFSTEILQLAHQSISEIIKTAERYNIAPTEIRGVATAAFRESTNANNFIDQILKTQNLKITIISQIAEAKLGYFSIYSLFKNPNQRFFVWDIGGGSMQITSKDPKDHSFTIFTGQLASVSFKNFLIETIQKKSTLNSSTPNPITKKEAEKGLEFSQNHAKDFVQPEIKKTIKTSLVYGIGGVLAISLPKQILGQNSISNTIENQNGLNLTITLKDIEKRIEMNLNKKDSELNSKYAETDVSNLILVAGYMRALGIKEYFVGSVNNTSGILLDSTYWQ